MKQILSITAFALVLALGLTSCTGGNTENNSAAIEDAAIDTSEKMDVAATPAAEAQVLMLEGNDQIQFNQKEFKVKAGQVITLTLKHTGKLAKTAMGHNFVLLKIGTDVNAFAQKAIEAKDNDYIPQSETASIIAYTKLLGGGEADTISFTIAEKGSYDFICSFPGHFAMMKGKLIVE